MVKTGRGRQAILENRLQARVAAGRHTALALALAAVVVAFVVQEARADSQLFGTLERRGTESILVELDPDTGALMRTIGPVGETVNGLTYDETTCTLYGTTTWPGRLITIDPDTGAATGIGGNFPGPINNITVNSSGDLFGWARRISAQGLWRIDKTTGVATHVGDPGLGEARYGLAFDNADNLFFVNSNGWTYQVDPGTGAANFLFDIGPQAHHGDIDPETDLYYGISTTGNPRSLVVADFTTGNTISTIPTVNDLHTLAFVAPPVDSDLDGIVDCCEGIFGTDPLDPNDPASSADDIDGDGLDWIRECDYRTDPTDADTDDDGLLDGEEVDVYGSEPLIEDTDRDLTNDGDEVAVGRDPLDGFDDPQVTRLTESNSISDQPDIIFDPNGNAHVVWVDDRDGQYELFYKMLSPAGATLIDDTRITDDDGDNSVRPVVGIDSMDRLFVVWHDTRDDANAEVYFCRLEPGLDDQNGGPADPAVIKTLGDMRLSVDDGDTDSTPRIAVDGNNDLHIVWNQDDDDIYYTKLNGNGAVLVPPRPLGTPEGDMWRPVPDLAIDKFGYVHVAWNDWTDFDPDNNEIVYCLLNGANGATLIAPTWMTSSPLNTDIWSNRQSISVDSNGRAYIVWKKVDDDNRTDTDLYFMQITPWLDDQDGSAANPAAIKTIADKRLTPLDGMKAFHAFSRMSPQNQLLVAYYETPFVPNAFQGPKDTLRHMVVDLNGNVIDGPNTLAGGTAFNFGNEGWTNPHIAFASSHIVFSDDRSGDAEVIMFTLDTEPPTDVSAWVMSSRDTIDDRRALVVIGAKDDTAVTGYFVSENNVPPPLGAFIPIANPVKEFEDTVFVVLSGGDGTKTVFAFFRDAAGNISVAAVDTVKLQELETNSSSNNSGNGGGSSDDGPCFVATVAHDSPFDVESKQRMTQKWAGWVGLLVLAGMGGCFVRRRMKSR